MKPFSLSVFISSRNNDSFVIDGKIGDSLTEVRLVIQKQLESQLLFGKPFLNVRINESFAADASLDSYNNCMEEARNADFVVVLYNGVAGWAPAGIRMGICHAELDAALQVSSKKITIIDISAFFNITPANDDERLRNVDYQTYISKLNKFNNPLKLLKKNRNNDGLKQGLLGAITNSISDHLLKRVEYSNYYYGLSSANEVGLNWKKLKYEARAKEIKNVLSELVKNSLFFKDCLTQEHPIPDKMSIEDAKAFTGRPFLNDQTLLKNTGKKIKRPAGPIHFIAVYETATEGQVKSMIGYPDISVIKEDFGYYVWEQNTHIQLVFLTECTTPNAIKTKYILFENWANASSELERMQSRAKARFHILKSINEAKEIANKK